MKSENDFDFTGRIAGTIFPYVETMTKLILCTVEWILSLFYTKGVMANTEKFIQEDNERL